MEQHAVVLDVSRYRPADGKRDEMLAEMKKIADRANAADGCFGAQVCISSSDKDAIVAVSRWKARAALETFAKEVEAMGSRAQLTQLLNGRAEHENLTPI